MNESIRDLGEQRLLKLLQSFCPPELIGDDAAVLTVGAGEKLVVTTDLLVDNVHFSDRTTSAADTGWRAAAANLSDLAAMGASPLGITVGLGLPGDLPVQWVKELYQGLTTCLQQYSTSIVGGDVCRSSVVTVAIAAFGEVDPRRVIRRSAAQPGDAIVVTGQHGASRAGMELLLHPEIGVNLEEQARSYLIQAHQRPNPRLDVLPLLWKSFSHQSVECRVAGMDSSDGLADAIVQICQMSQVGARIERSQIPTPSLEWLSSEQTLAWALYGGEDYELVMCMPPEIAQTLVEQLGNSASIIGTITEDAVRLVDSAGNYPDENLSLSQGFQHFG
jgi:thiamine-monophosphate kinase